MSKHKLIVSLAAIALLAAGCTSSTPSGQGSNTTNSSDNSSANMQMGTGSNSGSNNSQTATPPSSSSSNNSANSSTSAKPNNSTSSSTSSGTKSTSGSSTSAQPAKASVSIAGFAFSPATLTVKKGTVVTWTNNDSVPHTVTGGSGGPSSGSLQHGDSYSFTFNHAGTFNYHCAIHPNMTAMVIVQ